MADTRAWLRKARADLEAARVLATHDPPFADIVAFHAQQAVEKALKAVLYWHDVAFKKTHDLEELGSQVVEVEPELASSVEYVSDLTAFAIEPRYPEFEGASPTQAEHAIELAAGVFEAVLGRLPPEAHP